MKTYNPGFKFELKPEQRRIVLEMLGWVYNGEFEVKENGYDRYTLCRKPMQTTRLYNGYSFEYIGQLEALIFVIPSKLGMDIVVADVEAPEFLFDQVYEKYCIARDIPEKSEKKRKYKNSNDYEKKNTEEQYNFCEY